MNDKNMKKILSNGIVIGTFLNVVLFGTVFAQGIKDIEGPLGRAVGPTGFQGREEIAPIVGTAINMVLSMVGLIFLILMVYAGMLWMTARGEESQVETAQKIIKASMIGLFVVVSAYAITFLVTSRFQ